ncbi:Deoxyribonuclease V [Methanosalsum zhilinae DSM 4017]|uniref:Endonuclease V n=1 Tax=Methanosalsum zhilinae (strain DSM 4017 / NBRC 107636 / OCM 62 / WeN5) TaxID=679901 RepID=F7XNM4_METZD|nr:endonuclease V [Methanosalsum zhilinae]AEH60123.1 Deoxyribonuclease V [Methanosalsum zhilinae DSM 4017]
MNRLNKTQLIYPESYERDSLIKIQHEISEYVTIEDRFDKLHLIGGADCAFVKDSIICSAVVMDYDTMEIIEKAAVIEPVTFPYIPTFLSFREAAPMINAVLRLKNIPDILMIDGCGINHPRMAGLATHIGVSMDMPTIGIAKKILCGVSDEPQNVSDAKPLKYNGRQVGWYLKSSKRSNPIVIAPGHRVSVKTSLTVVRNCLRGYKLPETTRNAHLEAGRIKQEIKHEQ